MATVYTRASKGSALTWAEGDANINNLNNAKIENVVDDTTPQLGGNLDVNGNSIVSVSNGDITLAPHGTGRVVLDGLDWPPAEQVSSSISGTVTAISDMPDQLTLSNSTGVAIDQTITFSGSDVTSAGLSTSTTYYIINVSGSNIEISTTQQGFPFNLTVVSPITDFSYNIDNSIPAPTGGEVLTYNSNGSLTWTDLPPSGAENLGDLNDVSTAGATNGQVLTFNGSTWSGSTPSSGGGINDIVEDTTPQLGGDLDVNSRKIVSTNNGNIDLDPDGTGKVIINAELQMTSGGGIFAYDPGAQKFTFDYPIQTSNLKIQSNEIVAMNSNGNIALNPDGTGKVQLDGLYWPNTDGTNGQVLKTDGAGNLSWTTVTSGITDVVQDTTPQLGGNLDVNGQQIVSVSNGNIVLAPNGTGIVRADKSIQIQAEGELRLADTDSSNYVGFKSPATVSANKIWTLPSSDGTNGQVLQTNGSGTLSWATAGGGGDLVNDTTPQLGGDLDVGDYQIVNDTGNNGGIRLADTYVFINKESLTSGSAYVSTFRQNLIVGADAGNNYNGGAQVELRYGANANAYLKSSGTGSVYLTGNSGYVYIDGLRWPDADGTNGQVLQTNGSGTLSWATAGGGGNNVILLTSSNSDATMTFPSTNDTVSTNSWVLESAGGVSGVSVNATNKTFTLPAGTYVAWFPQTWGRSNTEGSFKLYNETGAANLLVISGQNTGMTINGQSRPNYGNSSCVFILSASTTLSVRTNNAAGSNYTVGSTPVSSSLGKYLLTIVKIA